MEHTACVLPCVVWRGPCAPQGTAAAVFFGPASDAPPPLPPAPPPAPLPLQVLAAFLKAIGFIIPLMDAMYANYYTREVMVILIR